MIPDVYRDDLIGIGRCLMKIVPIVLPFILLDPYRRHRWRKVRKFMRSVFRFLGLGAAMVGVFFGGLVCRVLGVDEMSS